VKKVELEDKSQDDTLKLDPKGVPLPESPGATPPPDSQPLDETSEEVEKVKDTENTDTHPEASVSGEDDAAESTRDEATLLQDTPSESVEDATNARDATAVVDSPSKPDAPDTQDTREAEE